MSYKTVKEVVTMLSKCNFKFVRQTGSHMVFTNGKKVVVVPNHRNGIEKGTYYSILKQAGLK
ncbi:type II toxin-antitoxin system HicA family toxin [Odoribacter laneus]|jgi:mRNA interferase HicA|uniref:type II toxin-antitoxin system HicA family toxin n=1 Tax=Odoribacter laneus TaxID=626933 RepID=UPI003FEF299E